MAGLTLFHYQYKDSLLHNTLPQIKLFFLPLYALTTINTGMLGLLLLSLTLTLLFVTSGLSAGVLLREGKFLLLLGLFIFISRTLVPFPTDFSATAAQAAYGAVSFWRFMLVVIIGLLFITTTESGDIEGGISFFLRPFPRPVRQVSTRIALTITFIPLIIDRAHEYIEARNSRCGNQRNNYLDRIIMLTVPLLYHIIELGDETALAMEARAFDGTPRTLSNPPPAGNTTNDSTCAHTSRSCLKKDRLFLCLGLLIAVMAWLL